MSLGSKIALGTAVVFTTSVISYVHVKQQKDRESLREGVIKDLQRQNMKRTANIKAQQDQIEITKSLRMQRDLEEQNDKSNKETEHS